MSPIIHAPLLIIINNIIHTGFIKFDPKVSGREGLFQEHDISKAICLSSHNPLIISTVTEFSRFKQSTKINETLCIDKVVLLKSYVLSVPPLFHY